MATSSLRSELASVVAEAPQAPKSDPKAPKTPRDPNAPRKVRGWIQGRQVKCLNALADGPLTAHYIALFSETREGNIQDVVGHGADTPALAKARDERTQEMYGHKPLQLLGLVSTRIVKDEGTRVVMYELTQLGHKALAHIIENGNMRPDWYSEGSSACETTSEEAGI